MAGLILMILAVVIALGLFGFGIFRVVKLVKSPTPRANNYPLETRRFIYLSIATSVATLLIFVFLSIYHKYPLNAGDWAYLIFGSLLFGVGLPSGFYAFVLHYYGKEIPEQLNKWLFRSIFFATASILIGLWFITNGIADYIDYPLTNGVGAAGFLYPGQTASGFKIAWYALCILSGAVLVYVICDHRFYVEYGKHGILESTFFVAFPAGIIGARLGYVIGEWNKIPESGQSFAQRVAAGQWWAPIAIWEGGLTIISGALVGIIIGVLWFIWRNKKYSIWLAVDIIVPCILIAQGIGRWGNFFNAEVHGNPVLASNWWVLPKIVLNNVAYSEFAGKADPGMIYLPLFYIEFLTNFIGYFFIRFVLGKAMRKYVELGDLAFSYIVWYGLTRVAMEPLRHEHYNMGQDGYWSWFWSIIFVLVGTLLIFANHLVRYLIELKKGEKKFKKMSVTWTLFVATFTGVLSVGLIIIGAIFMGKNVRSQMIQFDPYNVSLIMLVLGLSLLFLFGCVVLYLIRGIKKERLELKK